MAQTWESFLDGDTEILQPTSSLLPSSLREVWNESNNVQITPAVNTVLPRPTTPQWNAPLANPISTPLQPSSPPAHMAPRKRYFTVQFHPNRTQIVKSTQNLNLHIGDYILTEADRGFDLGRIVSEEMRPSERDTSTAKNILRKASQHEISLLGTKTEKEIKAREICQTKANELGLQMVITATELQFDGKKLTVYFKANQYIDFRNLVHTLFRVFGTRIWMVWYDGNAPVRDVFTHNEEQAINAA